MEVMGISLEIPAEILRAVKLPAKEVEQEFCKELALALYQRGALPLGKARYGSRRGHSVWAWSSVTLQP
jgi:predicted HTH domain antitoxin